jgi:hypothetical protein
VICRVNDNIILYPTFLLSIAIFVFLGISNAYAHISQQNRTFAAVQEWETQQDNVRIQFSYSPERPLVYTETDLIFSVQDLNTRNHIKDLIASITIIKNDRIFFKFNDVDIQNGDLSLKVRFIEDGNYQVISQIRSTDNIGIAMTSFNIHVPLQPFGKFSANALASSLIPAGLVAIGIISVSIIVLILISRKKEKADKVTGGEEQKDRKSDGDS